MFDAFGISTSTEEIPQTGKIITNETKTPFSNVSNVEGYEFIAKVKWGLIEIVCHSFEILTPEREITSFIQSMFPQKQLEFGNLSHRFQEYIEECQKAKMMVQVHGEIVTEVENPEIVAKLCVAENLKKTFLRQNNKLFVSNLTPSNIDLIGTLLKVLFIRCAFHSKLNNFGPCDENQTDILQPVGGDKIFLFSQNDKVCQRDTPPTLAFCANTDGLQTSEFTGRNQKVEVLNQLGNNIMANIPTYSSCERLQKWEEAAEKFRHCLFLKNLF